MKKEDDIIEIPFGARDSELCGWEYTIPEGYEAEIKDGKVIVKKKESEDERIRKEIVDFISWAIDRGSITNEQRERSDSWLAYLEKQKEQTKIIADRCSTDFEIEVHEIITQARSDRRLADPDVLKQFEQEAACALMMKVKKEKVQKHIDEQAVDEMQYKIRFENGVDSVCKKWTNDEREAFKIACNAIEYIIRLGGHTTDEYKLDFTDAKAILEKIRPLRREDFTNEDALTIKEIQIALATQIKDEDRRVKLCRWMDRHLNAFPIPEKCIPHWKPSEEQINALSSCVTLGGLSYEGQENILIKLLNNLKKL